MSKYLIWIPVFLCFSVNVRAQQFPQAGDQVVLGYEKGVSGTDFSWHSHLDYAKDAFMVSSKDKQEEAVWYTKPIASKTDGKFVNIICIAGVSGTCCGKEKSDFILEVNDTPFFTFQVSTGGKGIHIKNKDGNELIFKEELKDGSDDRFGLLSVRIPARKLTPGKPVKLKVRSSAGGNGSWFMIFKTNLKEKELSASAPPVILNEKKEKRLVNIELTHLGSSEDARVFIDGTQTGKQRINFGQNKLSAFINEVTQKKELQIEVQTDQKKYSTALTIQPLRKFQVAFVQHTHTDIGYTRPQTEILAEHIRFIDYALDYCDATDNYPEEAKFRWTCETAWAVEEFIKTRPRQQVDRLVRRIKEGRIELTAMYFNFDGLPDETTLSASLNPNNVYKKLGIDQVELAMQNDVNGIGWCFTEYFQDLGIKYVTMGENGHRALIPFDKPTYFWWESPSGKKVMAYVGDHYMAGNAIIGSFESFEKFMLNITSERASSDFEYDLFPLQFMGCHGDNSPPSTMACENVIKWNEKYEYPKIRLSLYKDFLGEIEQKYGDQLQTVRGAWPDWWTDGFASGAREASAFRQAQSNNTANQTGFALAKILGYELPANTDFQQDELNKSLLFYGEHTFGADRSVREPFHEQTMIQRALKQSYAWEAYRRSCVMQETVMGMLQGQVTNVDVPSILIYNPLNWEYSGLVKIYADHVVMPPDGEFTITDPEGQIVPAQQFLGRGDGAFWLVDVKNLPALGYKQLFINTASKGKAARQKKDHDNIYENEWYRIVVDQKNGVITSMFDRELGQELLDPDAEYKMGALIYEEMKSRRSHEMHQRGEMTRTLPSRMTLARFAQGDIWDSYVFQGESKAGQGDNNLSVEMKIYHRHKRIDLCYHLQKKLNTDAEAVYVSFPFQLKDGKSFFEVPGGIIEAGVDQVPETSNDWNTVQNFASVRNSESQIVLVSHEVPLMQFGNINTGRYQKDGKPESEKIYSYVMNNYWTTNFNADQHGGFIWTYNLTSQPENDPESATRFGAGCRTPFLYRVLPATTNKKRGQTVGQVLHIANPNLYLVNMRPVNGKNEVILHLREINGENADVVVRSSHRNFRISFCDVLGNDLKGQNDALTIKPWETRFVKLSW